MRIHFCSATLVTALLLGCGEAGNLVAGPTRPIPQEPGDAFVQADATVRYYTIEGGFFALDAGSHQVYEPLDLPPEYRWDGLPVSFTAKLRTDLGSYRMVGPVVEVMRIERR